MKIFKWIVHNFWLKVIALIFAVITWFYVINIIEDSTGKPLLAKILPSYNRMVSKKLYVKAIFVGELPQGYNLELENVKIDPSFFIVAGPKYILNNVDKLETVPIDISKLKKTTIHEAQISPIAQSIDTEKLLVKVTIPIKKPSEEKAESQ